MSTKPGQLHYAAFEVPKIFYQEIQFYSAYAHDTGTKFSNNKTFILPTNRLDLLAILKSLLLWWFNWRYLPHMKDEALTPVTFKMEHLPIAHLDDGCAARAFEWTEAIFRRSQRIEDATRSALDRLRVEFEIERPRAGLVSPAALDSDAFIAAVREVVPKQRKLSGAEVAERLAADRTAGFLIEPTRQPHLERTRSHSPVLAVAAHREAHEGRAVRIVPEFTSVREGDQDVALRRSVALPEAPLVPALTG